MTRRIALYSGVFTLLLASPAFAHHPGGAGNTGGAGPIVTISASTLEAGHGAVAFLYEYIKFGGLGDAELIAAAGKHIHAHSIGTIQSASLGAAYGVTDDFMVSVRAAVGAPHRHPRRPSFAPPRRHREQHGRLSRRFARASATSRCSAQYRFLNNQATRTEAAFLFGVKAPTGATNRIDQQGLLFETEFQPGSGSWDLLLGAAFTQRFGAWSFDANVLGVLSRARHAGHQARRPLPLQRGAVLPACRLRGRPRPARLAAVVGDVARAGAAPPRASARQDPGAAPQWTVDAMLELNGEWHDFEDIAGVTRPELRRHVLLLSPGLRIARGAFSGFASFGIPIVNEMNGLQSKTELSRPHRHRLCVLREPS